MKRKLLIALVALGSVAAALPARAVDGGSNIGATDEASVFLARWCQGSTGILHDFLEQARLNYSFGDIQQAKRTLKSGLLVALSQSDAKAQESLMFRALGRGVVLADAIDQALELDSLVSPVAGYDFLRSYYGFLLEEASLNDTAYHVPFLRGTSCATCSTGWELEYERRFQRYAVKQMDWLLSSFSSRTRLSGVTPKYSAKLFLKAAELIAEFAAEDLADSLWRAQYACAIDQLKLLKIKLTDFNNGNIAAYRDDQVAVASSANELTGIMNRIGGRCFR